eukprot:12115736-Alexandrium_andersonii.AAC.1
MHVRIALAANHNGDAFFKNFGGGKEHDAVDPPLGPFDGLDILGPRRGHSAVLGLNRGRIRGGERPFVPVRV